MQNNTSSMISFVTTHAKMTTRRIYSSANWYKLLDTMTQYFELAEQKK